MNDGVSLDAIKKCVCVCLIVLYMGTRSTSFSFTRKWSWLKVSDKTLTNGKWPNVFHLSGEIISDPRHHLYYSIIKPHVPLCNLIPFI